MAVISRKPELLTQVYGFSADPVLTYALTVGTLFDRAQACLGLRACPVTRLTARPRPTRTKPGQRTAPKAGRVTTPSFREEAQGPWIERHARPRVPEDPEPGSPGQHSAR